MEALTRRRFLVMTCALAAAGCAAPDRGQGARPGDALAGLYAWPERDEWPPEFRRLPEETQVMYRYAVVNKPVLQYMPCTCGCVNGGHGSNYDCYVREALPDGRVRLDTMSFG